MQAHFTISEILAATRGALLKAGAADTLVGVSTDSRTCQAGQLFIPLKGEHHDGHGYLPKALHRGAGGVLVETGWHWGEGRAAASRAPVFPPEVTVIAVADTLTALGDLAQAWRRRFLIPVVAITGSCGKTTTKEMIARVLSRSFRVLKNRLNLNNLIGLPLTLLGLDATHEAAVTEMGMNRFGEIRRLTQIAGPTIGVLTNVHPAHTEGVGDVSGVAQAKGELVEALRRDATFIYNADDPWPACLAREFPGRSLGFGFSENADLQARDRHALGRCGQLAQLHFQGCSWQLTLLAPGPHMLYNALAATAVGLCLGLPPEETARSLADFEAVARRSQVITLPSGVYLLNDCYNANPGSMGTALETLAELRDRGRTAAALADMLELGQGAVAAHRDLGRRAALSGLDLLVICGNFRREVAEGAAEAGLSPERIVPVADKAHGAQILREFLKPGDWLLVKGSRSMHMENLVELLAGHQRMLRD